MKIMFKIRNKLVNFTTICVEEESQNWFKTRWYLTYESEKEESGTEGCKQRGKQILRHLGDVALKVEWTKIRHEGTAS